MTPEQIDTKITELEAAKAKYLADAQAEVTRQLGLFDGQIIAYKAMRDTLVKRD